MALLSRPTTKFLLPGPVIIGGTLGPCKWRNGFKHVATCKKPIRAKKEKQYKTKSTHHFFFFLLIARY